MAARNGHVLPWTRTIHDVGRLPVMRGWTTGRKLSALGGFHQVQSPASVRKISQFPRLVLCHSFLLGPRVRSTKRKRVNDLRRIPTRLRVVLVLLGLGPNLALSS
jgi:hypothetical protein